MNTSANIEAVRRLCERWAWLSEKEFTELVSQDCIYYDMPFPDAKAIGPKAAHAKLSPIQKDWEVGLEVVSIVGDANTVIAERVEHFRNKTNAVEPFDLPVSESLRWPMAKSRRGVTTGTNPRPNRC
jgi:limonene-1,2-epoxide hydrolase